MYCCVCLCTYIYAGVHVCLCVYIEECIRVRGYVCVSSCVWLRITVFWTRLVRYGPLQEIRTRFGFVLVVDPIHRRFENRSMRWSVDQYRFVQWRPDGDSIPKPRHFIWAFVLVYLPLSVWFTCYTYHFMWLSFMFYQFDFLYYFMRHPWLFTLIT